MFNLLICVYYMSSRNKVQVLFQQLFELCEIIANMNQSEKDIQFYVLFL